MTYLYPRLSLLEGRELIAGYRSLTLEQIRAHAGTHRADAVAPTGGVPAGPQILAHLAKQVRTCAEMYGYPDTVGDARHVGFDRSTGALLREVMEIAPAEAAEPDVWTYMAVSLIPDVVFWRFGLGNDERWLGTGIVRHTFARLWWQAHVLRIVHDGVPDYTLANSLPENELNQIFERRSIGGNPPLARALARALSHPESNRLGVPRRYLVRDATKRVRRLMAFTSFLGMAEESVDSRVWQTLRESAAAFQNSEGPR
jgi:hypothetical protein